MLATNDLKKGQRVKLRNGWHAELMDNKKGNIRLAKVFGTYTETGSVYSHDIMEYLSEPGAIWQPVEHTEKQVQCREMNESLFG